MSSCHMARTSHRISALALGGMGRVLNPRARGAEPPAACAMFTWIHMVPGSSIDLAAGARGKPSDSFTGWGSRPGAAGERLQARRWA
jgi:hypothetical protein